MSTLFALVIEDNKDQADITAKALQAAGFTTKVILDGDDAVEQLNIVVQTWWC